MIRDIISMFRRRAPQVELTLIPTAVQGREATAQIVRALKLALAGQQWNNVSLMSQPVAGGSQVEAQGREINATLTMRDNAPWLANVRYLYFNPASASGQNATENVHEGEASDRKSTRLNSSHYQQSRMPSSA